MNGEALLQLVLGLAALLGIGAGFVGLFVLRVEHTALVQRVEQLESEPEDGRR